MKNNNLIKKEINCLYCKNKFNHYYKQKRKFCNHSCSASYNNLKNSKSRSNNLKEKWKDKNSIYNFEEHRKKLSNQNRQTMINLLAKNPDYNKKPHPKLIKLWSMKNSPYRTKQATENRAKNISISLKGLMIGAKNHMYGKITYKKMYFVKDLNHKVRSSWEEEICRILKNNNINYNYEEKFYPIDKIKKTYTPDITIRKTNIIEIKGPIFNWQLEKLKEFKKQYDYLKLIIICGKYDMNKFNFANIVFAYENIINNGGKELVHYLGRN